MPKIKTIGGLPVFSAVIGSDSDGMLCISLVDAPAVESNFEAFDAQKAVVKYSIQDEEKRLILGVVMRAGFPIYRRDDKVGEYYIIYDAETIREMAQKYLAEDRANLVNLMHEGKPDVEGVELVQWFLKDSEKGLAPAGFDDIKDGSLFAEFHVTNDEVWAAIKDGTYKGFSLEGLFTLEPVTLQKQQPAPAIEQPTIFNKLNSIMGKRIKAIFTALAAILVTMGKVATDKGILSYDGDEDLKAGDAVKLDQEDGTQVDAPDDIYTTDDGKKITVKDGKVESIEDPEAQVAPEDLGNQDPKEVKAAKVNAAEEGQEGAGDTSGDRALVERVDMLEKAVKRIAEYFGMVIIELKKTDAKVVEMGKQPAATPATKETPELEQRFVKTGDEKIDHMHSIMTAKKTPLEKK